MGCHIIKVCKQAKERVGALHSLDLNDLSAMYRKAAQEGEWQPLVEYLSSSYWKDSSIRNT